MECGENNIKNEVRDEDRIETINQFVGQDRRAKKKEKWERKRTERKINKEQKEKS